MAAPSYEFGPYRLNVSTRRLLRDGEPVSLTPKAFDTLLALIERRDRVVDKAELMRLVWPDSFVEEANLSQTVFVLRKTLGADVNGRQYIDTVPRHGYRFAAGVREDTAKTVAAPESAGHVSPHRQVAVAAVGVALIAAVAIWWATQDRSTSADPLAGMTRVVVLPFENLTDSRADDWLASAFSDSLTSGLQDVANLIPVSRDRIVELYRQREIREASAVDAAVLKEMSQILGVRYYVHGSYQKLGEQIKVVVRLVDSNDGTIRAQESVTDDFANLLKLEDTLANRFAARLEAGQRAAAGRAETSSLEAYRAVVEARVAYASGATLRDGLALLQRAIELDPRYAQAWALRGKTKARLAAPGSYTGGSVDELREGALADAQRAVELDPSLYEAHVALALAYRELAQAAPWRAEAEQAIALNPRVAEAYALLADWDGATPSFGCARGYDARRAEAHYRTALRLDPRFSIAWGNLINHLVWAHRVDEALRVAEEGLSILPDSVTIRRARNMALVIAGRVTEGEQEIRATAGPTTLYDQWLLATIALTRGDVVVASNEFAAVLAAMPDASYDFRVGLSYFMVNRIDEALQHVDHAVKLSPDCARFAAMSPAFAPYRGTPQFRARLAAWN